MTELSEFVTELSELARGVMAGFHNLGTHVGTLDLGTHVGTLDLVTHVGAVDTLEGVRE